MKTEKQKMLMGELYDPSDRELSNDRLQARLLLKELNDSREDEASKRVDLLKKLIPNTGVNLYIQTPFYCDYGENIEIGNDVYFNFNCVILDVNRVKIGSRTMFGPNVQVYTATHPIDYKERASGLEFAKPITIGEDVWIGGSAIICPGVSIGDRSIIGAGSVVTKDVPSDVFAAGNPCVIIRNLKT
ncbi:maltose O-acetyltransferase [Marivirga lumbricoides]|uniref:Acetyltransferase n=1 Tax=Marivirga lumbricoides TaxID=1046115 RepID=A0ABQ1LC74_9BACT|nr:maltose O-acetyltransferase [Marivirga lumbricoides]